MTLDALTASTSPAHRGALTRLPRLTFLIVSVLLVLGSGCVIEDDDSGDGSADAGADAGTDGSADAGTDGSEPCAAGDTQLAADGCNTCTCQADGSWACTAMGCLPQPCAEAACGPAPDAPSQLCDDGSTAGPVCDRDASGACGWRVTSCPDEPTGCYSDGDCADGQVCNATDVCAAPPDCPGCTACYGWCVDPGAACTPGDARPAADDCNTCTCQADGSWACTLIDCAPVGACATDADCVVSGCSGQLCAAQALDSTCEWLPEYACYDDAITSCGCNDGVCGWAQTPEFDACLGDPPCIGGETRLADDGCNTCTCQPDGSWACTEIACEDPSAALCADTGGQWLEDTCGHHLCGQEPLCDAVIPGCDCGPGASFSQGTGCAPDPSCDQGSASLCEDTGGTWHVDACGDYWCGYAPDCLAIVPGCDCGAGSNYVPGQGCVADPACGQSDASLCAGTGGTWHVDSCGDYWCGQAPACFAVIPGCDCGADSNFVSGQGCAADPACAP